MDLEGRVRRTWPLHRPQEVFFQLHDEHVTAFRKDPNLHREFYQRVIPHVIQKKSRTSHSAQKMSSWSFDRKGHLEHCVEQYCEMAKKSVFQLQQAGTPCVDDHQWNMEDLEAVGELALFDVPIFSQIWLA